MIISEVITILSSHATKSSGIGLLFEKQIEVKALVLGPSQRVFEIFSYMDSAAAGLIPGCKLWLSVGYTSEGSSQMFLCDSSGEWRNQERRGSGGHCQRGWTVSLWRARVRSSLARTFSPFSSFPPTSNLRGPCSHIS